MALPPGAPIAAVAPDSGGHASSGCAPWWDDGTPAAASRLTVMRNLGDGAFTIPQRLSAPLRPAAIAAADVDHDGRVDLLAAGRCGAAESPCRATDAGLLGVWRGSRTTGASRESSAGAAR